MFIQLYHLAYLSDSFAYQIVKKFHNFFLKIELKISDFSENSSKFKNYFKIKFVKSGAQTVCHIKVSYKHITLQYSNPMFIYCIAMRNKK